MSPLEIVFALQPQPPFDSLRDSELEVIASVMTQKRFAPGALILGSGEPFQRLLVRLNGNWLTGDRELPALLGVHSLLTGEEGPGEVKAGAGGCQCLTMSRGHFFTIINECPKLLLSFYSMPGPQDKAALFL